MRNLLKSFLALAIVGAFVGCDDDPAGPTTPSNATEFSVDNINVQDAAGTSVAATTVTITDKGLGVGTRTLFNDTTYILDGFVFVNEGQTLTIEAGTVIKGQAGAGEQASALIVARGASINANGSATSPIIFTSVTDQTFSTSQGIVSTNNLGSEITGLWGGVIVLGKASLNSDPGESAIEGIPTSELRGIYGGTADNDNSGTLRYISIRHGGTDIGGGNEINGLTMGGVGSGTTIEYIEVFGNADDGFEWFGGTVNTKYLISSYNRDDAFDYDEGWRGLNQFWIAYQRTEADRGGEHDGGTNPETATPYATPTIANASYFGLGASAGKRAVTFRDNAGGNYYNSIFSGYGRGIDIEVTGGDQHSYQRFLDGELKFENNILFDVAGSLFTIVPSADDVTVPTDAQTNLDVYFANEGNTSVSDPMFAADGVTPMTGGAAQADVRAYTDSFFTNVNYKGAVDPAAGATWIQGWTRLSQEF